MNSPWKFLLLSLFSVFGQRQLSNVGERAVSYVDSWEIPLITKFRRILFIIGKTPLI
jgi:hypothetical protein